MMTNDLKPRPKLRKCPYCAKHPKLMDINKLTRGSWCMTHFCHKYEKDSVDLVTTVYAPTKEELITRWNRRASDE